jgi:hypothetical protein
VPRPIETSSDELKRRGFVHAVGLEGAAAINAEPVLSSARHRMNFGIALAIVGAIAMAADLASYAWPLSEKERARLFIYAASMPALLEECATRNPARDWQAGLHDASARAARFLKPARDRTTTSAWEAALEREFPHVPAFDDSRWLVVCPKLHEEFGSDEATTQTLERRFARQLRKLDIDVPPRR